MSLRFKVRAANTKEVVLDPLAPSTTMQQLQTAIINKLKLANTQPSCIEIKYLFQPPRPEVISQVAPNTTLSALPKKVTSGILTVSILDKAPPIILAQQPQQHHVPQNQKPEQKEASKHNDNQQASGSMMVKQIESDNSCLFNAVLLVAEEGTEDKAKGQELREIIASIVMSDPVKYNQAVLGKSTEQYVEYIMQPNTWGGDIELSILSTYYEVQINAIEVATMNAHRFGEDKNYKQCVYVIYDGIHYDAMVMKLDGDDKGYRYKFNTDDDSVFAQAFSIVAELNAQKKFTDVYNFGLLCDVCNAVLKGQNEAQKHAEATGHAKFSQFQ